LCVRSNNTKQKQKKSQIEKNERYFYFIKKKFISCNDLDIANRVLRYKKNRFSLFSLFGFEKINLEEEEENDYANQQQQQQENILYSDSSFY